MKQLAELGVDWGIVATWGIPVLALVIVGLGALQLTHRSGRKLDRIIAKLNVTQEDQR